MGRDGDEKLAEAVEKFPPTRRKSQIEAGEGHTFKIDRKTCISKRCKAKS